MKEFWIEIDESLSGDLKDNLLKRAANVCDVVLVGAKDAENAKKVAVKIAANQSESDINVISTFNESIINDLKRTGKTVAVRVTIASMEDERNAIKAAELSPDYLVLQCPDWKIIPLENLIAKTRGKTKLLAEVSDAEEAKFALETLELGADGIVLKTSSPDEIMETEAIVKKKASKLELVAAKVVEIKEIGTGARVCVDTCDLMKSGEGILVGCQSSGLFLVQAEVHENPYIETRPFRVNSGPVSLYTLCSPTRTRYLSELKSGDEVLIVDRDGKTRLTNVARVKIEWRPMVLIEAEYEVKRIKTIVQNAETIRLVTPEGSKSIEELKIGDKVLAHVIEGGRHFGTLVKERVMEH